MPELRVLTDSAAVDASMLDLVADCVVGWFPPSRRLDVDDFFDRLCFDYLNGVGWDIENLDSPAARKILRHARQVRRDLA